MPVPADIPDSVTGPVDGDIDLNGRWVDMNGGEIEIKHGGEKVIATGLTEKVTRHWTKGVGKLRGTSITMTHYQGERENARKLGRVAKDGSRIHWGRTNHWKRLPEEE